MSKDIATEKMAELANTAWENASFLNRNLTGPLPENEKTQLGPDAGSFTIPGKPKQCTGNCVISGVIMDSCFTCGWQADDYGAGGSDEYASKL